MKDTIERFVILSPGAEVRPKDLPMEMTHGISGASGSSPLAGANPYMGMTLREAREAVERDLIQAVLERHQGNITHAADELELDRTQLHRRIKGFGLGVE